MKTGRAILLLGILAAAVVITAGCITPAEVSAEVTSVSVFGNAVLDIKPEVLADAGFSFGDMVSVSINGQTVTMPYLDGFYVKSGDSVLRGKPETKTELAVNYGNFAKEFGVAAGDTVTITLKEKGGAQFLQNIGGEHYSSDRTDFPSDEAFANFRMVTLGEIAEGALYRSASPVNNESGRAETADNLAEAVSIRTVLNLADTDEEVLAYTKEDDFASAYYLGLFEDDAIRLSPISGDFDSPEFATSVTEGLVFLAENEPPYLIHCREGKDRAGLVTALVGALMGADADVIIRDYMISYENYYGLTEDDEAEYVYIADGNMGVFLRYLAGLNETASLEGVNLQPYAEQFLRDNGMTADEVSLLQKKLQGD